MQTNRNDLFLHYLKVIFIIYVFYIFTFFIFRTFFIFYFGDWNFLKEHLGDLGYAYFLGWRYDTVVCSYILAPIFLIAVLFAILKSKTLDIFFHFLFRWYALFGFIFLIVILVSDMGFYSYFQDHLNILFYGFIEDDTTALLQSIEKDYPFKTLIAALLLLFTGVYFLFKKWIKSYPFGRSKFTKNPLVFIFSLSLSFILLIGGLRGGYSQLVISPKYSDFSEHEFINQISLNGVISFESAMQLRASRNNANVDFAKLYGYGNINEALKDYLQDRYNPAADFLTNITRKTQPNAYLKENPPHIIVLVMESFGAHWLKYNSENFNFLGNLKTHFLEDFYFERIVSEDNGTIGSLMAIATNIPNRRGARFLSESKYMQMPLTSAGHVPYKNTGYETSFYYGGKLGWRDIGKYFRYQGYDNLRGENFIKSNQKLTGAVGTEWGLYDEHFFNDIYLQLKNATKPQMILGLSTTNHPPFEFPTTYKKQIFTLPQELEQRINREKDIFIERFEAFEYSNQKLAEFIQKIKDSDLGKKTIIAVTGDHNFWGFVNYDRSEAFVKHSVPMYFYIPKDLAPKSFNAKKLGSHKDIFTTLYHLSLSEVDYVSFGQNLFNDHSGFAFNNSVIANDEAVMYKDKFFKWDGFDKIEINESEVNKTLLKYYQSTISVADYYLRLLFKKVK